MTYVNKGQALAPWIPLATPQGWSMSLQHIDIRLPGENEHEKGNGPHLPGIGVQNKPASRNRAFNFGLARRRIHRTDATTLSLGDAVQSGRAPRRPKIGANAGVAIVEPSNSVANAVSGRKRTLALHLFGRL